MNENVAASPVLYLEC